jgi:hypothetical protein
MPFSANCQKSQNREKKKLVIIGVVKNVDKTPIANAQIYVDTVYTNQVSDELGNYRVVTTTDAKKIVAYSPKAGFCEVDINGQKTINLILTAKTLVLPRFIVENKIAFVEKKTKPKKVNVYTDIYQMIRQEVHGVLVTGRSIVVQQPNSFFGSTTPLFVVDGHIVPSLDYINPQEVKSIRLLKGSEATIYGNDGANGVICVTLLKGSDK